MNSLDKTTTAARFRLYHLAEVPGQLPELGFDLGEAITFFDFFTFIHPDNRALILRLLDPKSSTNVAANQKAKRERLAFFCDIMASFSAQLIYRDMLKPEFTAQALKFFDRALKGYGFEINPFENLGSLRPSSGMTSVVLVPGCQTEQVRNNRVLGAFTVAKKLQDPKLKIVCSGRHPPTNGKKLSDRYPAEFQEASSMLCHLYDLASKDQIAPNEIWDSAVAEGDSERTVENIKNFFSSFLPPDGEVHLWISSSTFHLPRIAREIFNLIVSNKESRIKRITLVAAEDEQSAVLGHQLYAKQMTWELFMTFYDVFNHGSEMKMLFSPTRSSRF